MTVEVLTADTLHPLTAHAPATFYTIYGGNDGYWRIEAPAKAIGAKVCALPEKRVEHDDGTVEEGAVYALLSPNTESGFRWGMEGDRNDPDWLRVTYHDHEGAAVWIRPDLTRAKHAFTMAHGGVRTLAEVDDNYLTDAHFNVYMRANMWTDANREEHLRSLFTNTGIVFSTDWLRDYYHWVAKKELGLGKRDMPDMHVCRNNVALADWPERLETDGPTRVGWMGSPSHVWDVDGAWAALMHARNLGCETWMVGYDPRNPWGSMEASRPDVISEKSADKIAQWSKVGFRFQPWVKPEKYHRLPLPLDIGLAPLLMNTHTNGKSDVKAIEYLISGACPVLQNTVVYNRTFVHGETAWLVGSPQEMLDAVDFLVKNPRVREEIVANGQQYVREERGSTQLREEWTDAIEGC